MRLLQWACLGGVAVMVVFFFLTGGTEPLHRDVWIGTPSFVIRSMPTGFIGLAFGLVAATLVVGPLIFLHLTSELIIDVDGITQRIGGIRRSCRWADACRFRRHASHGGFDYVDFDYSGTGGGWSSYYDPRVGIIWPNWGLDPWQISSLLNQAREKWGPRLPS